MSESKPPEICRKIVLVEGDITRQQVDAVVNAANRSLLGGGGVDGAIHRAAGPELLEECRKLGGCETGEAKVTRGYRLPAQWIIHAVGPVWRGGGHGEDELLAEAYRNSLKRATEVGARSIAFPAISTGAYRFPPERATRIAIEQVLKFLASDDRIAEVRFVCFGRDMYELYRRLLREICGELFREQA